MNKKQKTCEKPPSNKQDLATWFADAVYEEVKELEKNGGAKTYEIHSGRLIESRGQNQTIMIFFIADGTWIPEETSGRLKTQEGEFTATIIGQQGNVIHLNVEAQSVPKNIHFAKLVIDDSVLLRKLADVLKACSEDSNKLSSLALHVFHPLMTQVQKKSLPDNEKLRDISDKLKKIIEQASGSSITYIWGPPGTGKTYAIAHLITTLIENEERILVSSHTNSAVDQALYEAVKKENQYGPLATHSVIDNGQILRIGATYKSNRKIPDSVCFDKVLEAKGKIIQEEILEIKGKIKPLSEIIEWGRKSLVEWNKLAEFNARLNTTCLSIDKIFQDLKDKEDAVKEKKVIVKQNIEKVEQAKRSWFWRESKTTKSQVALEKSSLQLQDAENDFAYVLGEKEKLLKIRFRIEKIIEKQKLICEELPSADLIENEVSIKSEEIKPLEQKLDELQTNLNNLGQNILNNARAIFCTLTKTYVGKELEGQEFDAVIIDEISMALPPLIFLAAGRAKLRVILVGDFLQLPPIVRSDSELSNAILGKDTFHLAGVATDSKYVKNCKVMTKLDTQHRMLPEIANIARYLVYDNAGGLYDHDEVKQRQVKNPWENILPNNPVSIIDTADLFCWSGKQVGSLSRFNMYSATLSVELAAIAARKIEKPSENDSQPIGIITPYAAQRRLLSKMISDMKLDQWVAAGTVHTFQGNQADYIIFDTVLDEPYYTARLCNPKDDVKRIVRDLNVAVTRAKNKFIFIGSSAWLNKNAKPASALGLLWSYLKGQKDIELLSASYLAEHEFNKNISSVSTMPFAWELPKEDSIQFLDEMNFFDYFIKDINAAKKSIFALAPYFGNYRWPKIQPFFNLALSRNIHVTILTPPLIEAPNKSFVNKAISNLRSLGAVIIEASGIHGKDVIIDENIVYTGSMNWSSHRGRIESVLRINASNFAKQYLEYLQAKHIRQSATNEEGVHRFCPHCGWPLQVVNQKRQHFKWDFQAMKIGCTNPNRNECPGYLRDINERPPFKYIPVCQVDGKTKYRRVHHGRGEMWKCPKHPKGCEQFKVVQGDP